MALNPSADSGRQLDCIVFAKSLVSARLSGANLSCMSEEEKKTEPAVSEEAAEKESNDVHRLRLGDREFILIGTAHISKKSTELVREVIAAEKPDTVCVELDQRRYETS